MLACPMLYRGSTWPDMLHRMPRHDPDIFRSHAVSVSINAALMAELLPKLAEIGVLSAQDTHDIYDGALLSLEKSEADAEHNALREVYADARQIIETALDSTPKPPDV